MPLYPALSAGTELPRLNATFTWKKRQDLQAEYCLNVRAACFRDKDIYLRFGAYSYLRHFMKLKLVNLRRSWTNTRNETEKSKDKKKVWQNFSSIWKNISTSPGRDASPSQVIRPQFVRTFPTIFPYPFILLGGERHCETQWGTVSPARDRTWTARSGDERTNDESTASVASEI